MSIFRDVIKTLKNKIAVVLWHVIIMLKYLSFYICIKKYKKYKKSLEKIQFKIFCNFIITKIKKL